MKNDVVIKIENIGKKYSIGTREAYLTLRDRLIELPLKIFKKEKSKEFWALKSVSLEIERGEVIGIIGRNGAGKSTLLKILARITEPTEGKISMKGRVASMLEVGTGFNPELTGRENIYLNGAILGMKRVEIEQKFQEIVDFSGVEKFLDTPVKHYSSGMYVRLAFAVAAHLDSDILLVDEVLAVGDTEFQRKCLSKMDTLSKSGKTVIFVSHNLLTIRQLCSKILVLDQGKVKKFDKNISNIFNDSLFQGDSDAKLVNREDRKGNQLLKFSDIRIYQNNKECEIVNNSEPIKIKIKFNVKEDLEGVIIAVGIDGLFGQRLATISNELIEEKISAKIGVNNIIFDIEKIPFVSGDYTITLFSSSRGDITDWIQRAKKFKIIGKNYYKSGKEYIDQGDNLLDYKLNMHK